PGPSPSARRGRVRDRGARPPRRRAGPLHARLPAAQFSRSRRRARARDPARLTPLAMDALRVLADDLTGACDVGAELLPGSAGVVVQPAGGTPAADVAPGTICVRNTQSRTLDPAAAARVVREALGDVPVTWSGLVLKKIDTG